MTPRRRDTQHYPTVADAMISNPKLCDEATTVADVRRLFLDSHVHMAVVMRDARVISLVERSDLDTHLPDNAPVAGFGRLEGRVVAADESLASVHRTMRRNSQRRLAVIDSDDKLIGLLCLKRILAGFCTDQDVQARMISKA